MVHFWHVGGKKCGGSANLPGLTRIPNKQTQPPGCSRLDSSRGSWLLSAIPMAVRKPLFLAATDRRNLPLAPLSLVVGPSMSLE